MAKARAVRDARASTAKNTPTGGMPVWIAALVLAIAIGAVYGPALSVPFIYDDRSTILENSSIRSLSPLVGTAEHRGPLNPAPETPTAGRPVVNLSLAANYAVGGLRPDGYHLFNVVIHFLSSLLICMVVRRTLLSPCFGDRFSGSAGWLAFAVALLWALHPLQTESVVYTTQRTELMMALFYLATLYCSVRYLTARLVADVEGSEATSPSSPRQKNQRVAQQSPTAGPSGNLWLALAVVVCLAGMASKEVMVSAPLMVLLFDRAFISRSLPAALRRSWPLYVGLAATWLLLVALNISTPRSASAGFALRIPAYAWWLTQAQVFLMYLKLTVWPWPLLIYYELPILPALSQAWMYVLPVAMLGFGTLVLLWRNTSLGYLGTWVFAILAPTSIVPIVTETAAERRMYLPLVAIVVLMVVGGVYLMEHLGLLATSGSRSTSNSMRTGSRTGPIVVSAILVALTYAAIDTKHLRSFRDEQTLWREVIQYEPANAVAHNNLATLLIEGGRFADAVGVSESLIAQGVDHAVTFNNLGVALMNLGRVPEAKERFQKAVALKADYPDARSNYGLALGLTGNPEEAIKELTATQAASPNHRRTMLHLGIVYGNMGRNREAVAAYERLLQLDPNSVEAHVNLGAALDAVGKLPQAIEHFRFVAAATPNDPNAYNNLGLLLSKSQQNDEAIAQFERALRLAPNRSDVHHNMAQVYRRTGRTNAAIQHFQAAVQLKPDDVESLVGLAQSLAAAGRKQEASVAAEQAMQIARRTGQAELIKAAEDVSREVGAQQSGGEGASGKAQ